MTRERGSEIEGLPDKPRLLLVGGGEVGRELLPRLLPHWRVSVVEKDPAVVSGIRQDLARGKLSEFDCEVWSGDGTSSLILEEAGIEEADVVVSTISDERVNREVCRIATERYDRKKVIAFLQQDDESSLTLGPAVERVDPNQCLANLLERKIQSGKAGELSFGNEAGQILETTVMEGSPVVGREIEELNAQTWRIAAIFREGGLLLPHPDTTLAAGDRVLLVGPPEVLNAIAEYIRIGVSAFPRRYGEWLLLPVFAEPQPEGLFEEALYLAKNTKIRGVALICWTEESREPLHNYVRQFDAAGIQVRPSEAHEDPAAAIIEVVRQEDIGCLVLPSPSWRSTPRAIGKKQLIRILEAVNCPILIARGTHPYQRILVPVTDKAESIASAELAMDLGRLLGSKTSVASIVPPSFSVGEAELQSQREALEKTISLASAYRMRIEDIEQEGNPIREILRLEKQFDLLVVSHRRGRRWRPFRPDISHHLILKANSSVLVVEMGGQIR